jgi:hypothetical protein
MPDISMCRHTECELKYKCYRYTAIPDNYWQSFGTFDYPKIGRECTYFMSNEKSKYPSLEVELQSCVMYGENHQSKIKKIQEMIKQGVDVNYKDNNSRTALSIAKRWINYYEDKIEEVNKIIELLKQAGAE